MKTVFASVSSASVELGSFFTSESFLCAVFLVLEAEAILGIEDGCLGLYSLDNSITLLVDLAADVSAEFVICSRAKKEDGCK